MRKQMKTLLLSILVFALIFGFADKALADTGKFTIDVSPVEVKINGDIFQPTDANGKNVDVFIYDGTTYAPVRALAEAYGLDVDYDQENKIITVEGKTAIKNEDSLMINGVQTSVESYNINEQIYLSLETISTILGIDINYDNGNLNLNSNNIITTKTIDKNRNEIIFTDPVNMSSGNYFLWKYLNIVFADDVKECSNSNIKLVNLTTGSKVSVKTQPGINHKNNFLIIPDSYLELSHTYSLYIPCKSIKMANGTTFDEDIKIIFKMADTVIKGEIDSKENYAEKSIVLKGKNEEFESYVRGNEFFFTDIPAGKYELWLDGIKQTTITVKENTTNQVKVIVN